MELEKPKGISTHSNISDLCHLVKACIFTSLYMLLYFLIPSLLTFGSVELFLHWLRPGFTLGISGSCASYRQKWVMAGSDYCNIYAVAANSLCMYLHVCVCCAFHCFNITEGAETLFELLWGQLRSRARKETRVWKNPAPPSKMSAHLLTLLLVINGRGECPRGIKDLTHT